MAFFPSIKLIGRTVINNEVNTHKQYSVIYYTNLDILTKMIIPVRCVTCGNVLADKYAYFQKEVRRIKLARGIHVKQVVYFTTKNSEITPEGEVLNAIGLRNVCCRRHMLTHVDIE